MSPFSLAIARRYIGNCKFKISLEIGGDGVPRSRDFFHKICVGSCLVIALLFDRPDNPLNF